MVDDRENIFWIKSQGQKKLATENLVPGNQVYNESLVTKKGIEFRIWSPFRSKLAAALMNGLEEFPFQEKSSCKDRDRGHRCRQLLCSPVRSHYLRRQAKRRNRGRQKEALMNVAGDLERRQ